MKKLGNYNKIKEHKKEGTYEMEIKEQLDYIEQVKNKFAKPHYYYILTMGCQLNENDSEKLCGMLEKMEYQKVENMQEADIIVFNTCCIRENAEEKLFGKLGEAKEFKKKKGTIIAIGGCMMQEPHMVKKIRESYPYVDLIFGTHTLHKFPEDLEKVLEKNKIQDILDIDGEVYEGVPIKRQDKKKALVTIMYGCNNFCSYCIVPYVRGRERSRKQEDILKEIENLAKEGYEEITLLGQNVNSYQGSGKEKYGFSHLLRDIEKIEGIKKINFMSPHPKDFTDDVIEAIADSKKITRIIHLPLQSGSTEVLKNMNRKYTKEQYLTLVEKMQKRIPGIVFSTDIIVGFPGETEKDFEDTLDVVKKVHFEQVFMFIYSRRKGTTADKMDNQVPEEIKHKRFERLKQLVESQIAENNQKYIGTIQNILVEGKSKTNDYTLTGRTDTNKVVILEGEDDLIGKTIPIKIVSEHMWYLKGEKVRE